MADVVIPDSLHAGASPAEAVDAFEAACRQPYKTLWTTEAWLEPRKRLLLEHLSDPVTEAEVEALVDALLTRVSLDAVLVWLKIQPRPVWAEFWPRWQEKQLKRRLRMQEKDRSLLPRLNQYENVKLDLWSPTPEVEVPVHLFCHRKEPSERDVVYLGRFMGPAKGCPRCRMPPDQLDWQFVELISPFDGAREGEGWIALCHDCSLVVHSLLPRGGDFDARWEKAKEGHL